MKKNGFSMMELMIAIAIVAILAAIGIPSYLTHMKRSRRSDALQTLLSIQLQEEKYRINNTSYGDLDAVWGGVEETENGFYGLATSNLSATGYTLTATAKGGQIGDTANGSSCNTITLTNTAGVVTKAPAACWEQ